MERVTLVSGGAAHSGAPPAVIVIVGLVVLGIIILAAVAAHRRRQALMALAAAKGLTYYRRDSTVPSTYAETDLCSRGHSKKATNIITGPFGGGKVRYFDYKYTVGSGKNSHTYHKSACALHTGFHFTAMTVRPENVLDKVAGFFGFEDVDLDHAEFNRKFHVGCKDKKFAYDVLTQRVMQFFLDRPGVAMEIRWNYALFYYNGTIKPEMVSRLVDDSAAFVDLLPNYLKKDREMAAKSAPQSRGTQAAAGSDDRVSFDGIEPRQRRRRN